jgi:hypothetical protein
LRSGRPKSYLFYNKISYFFQELKNENLKIKLNYTGKEMNFNLNNSNRLGFGQSLSCGYLYFIFLTIGIDSLNYFMF